MMSAFEVRHAMHQGGLSAMALVGKAPKTQGWQKMLNATPEALARCLGTNTGMLTRHNPVADIDILDEEAAETAERVFRDWFDGKGTIPARIGQWPKRALVFRTSTPFSKIVQHYKAPNGALHKIEILGDGQQLAVHGIHPDTGKEFTWVGQPVWEVPADLVGVGAGEMGEVLHLVSDALQEMHGFQPIDAPETNGEAKELGRVHADSELAAMLPDGEDVNRVQTRVATSLILKAENPNEIVTRLVKATMDVARRHNLDWTQREEIAAARARVESQLRWLSKDYDHRTGEIPTWLCADFHKAWREILASGRCPAISKNRYGFYVRGTATEESKHRDSLEAPAVGIPQLPAGWTMLDLDNITPPAWRIKGIMPETGVLILPGVWGAYKTTALLDISYALMTGKAFANVYKVVEPCAIMMYALEGKDGINRRMLAATGKKMGEVRQLPFALCGECPPLTSPNSAKQIIAIVSQASIYMQHAFSMPVGVVWIDTYSNAVGHTASGDDCDRAATQKAYNTLRAIAQECRVVVAVVDHYGKLIEAGTTGSSGKEGNADTVLANLATRDTSGATTDMRMAVRKQRDGEAGFEIPFNVECVEICQDSDGDPVTAVKIKWGEAKATKVKVKPGANDKLLIRALDETLQAFGFSFRPDFDTEVTACQEEMLKQRFYELFPRGDGTDQQHQSRRAMAFERAMKKSIADNQIERCERTSGDVVFRTPT